MPNGNPASKKRRGGAKPRKAKGGGQTFYPPTKKAQVNRREVATAAWTPGMGSLSKSKVGGGFGLSCWDAKLPQHLPLPRPTGPYSVLRFTKRFTASSRVLVFGTFMMPNGSAGEWSNICVMHDVNGAAAINAANNCTLYAHNMSGLGPLATITPSALTVQIINADALSTTTGILYAGVCRTQLPIGGSALTWDNWADTFIATQSPRMVSGAGLCLKGVQINSYPINLTPLSDFTPMFQALSTLTFTYTATDAESRGFAPIVVVNTSGSLEPEYIVTTEYRVRFDLSNPAVATHRMFPTAPESIWSRNMQAAAGLGHGAFDIGDAISRFGSFAERAAPFAKAATKLVETFY